MSRGYHHGELRAALVRAARELIAERGVAEFSVAEVARRCAVSSAAPYRHFADRNALLAAVALSVAHELHDEVTAATARHTDPARRLADAAAAYTGYLIRHGTGLPTVFAGPLRGDRFPELRTAGRELTDEYLSLCFAVSPSAERALLLLEQLLTQAHGYATFYLDGVLSMQGYDLDVVTAKSAEAALTTINGSRLS
ncbi:TetR/AcrR family transcriptional regulator [Saccharopolyspora gloriosae]|uniref:AcrR family transcriptional regulator n=1 Tax=Saccharopolyspora gloriosae TaxID=455344 RepID=A0A840NLE1_9PSEU|nr:TetR/AcrR family transcriptional regulator [Saccharopolyspora gloriosae]MBB5070943.1 AcrR family transcriptional regulator [Saccharopolyspora gloriosae]